MKIDNLVHHWKTVGLRLAYRVRAIALAVVGAHALVLLEVVAEEVALVRVFAHAQACDGDAVQRVHVVCHAGLLLALLRAGGRYRGGTGALDSGCGEGYLGGARLRQVDVCWQLGDFALGFQEAGLQVDDVLAELIVLAGQLLHCVFEGFDVLDFFLELADVSFLALTECTLLNG
jgi:hypothetical protein